MDDDTRTFRGTALRNGFANTGGAARDDDDFIFKTHGQMITVLTQNLPRQSVDDLRQRLALPSKD